MAPRSLGIQTFLFLLFGSVVWGSALFAAAVAPSAPSYLGLPDWWFLLTPLTLVAVGAGLLASGTVLLLLWWKSGTVGEVPIRGMSVTRLWVLGGMWFLTFVGVGTALVGLIASSGFFNGNCDTPFPCSVVSISTGRLSLLGDVAIAGLAAFVVGALGLIASFFLPFSSGQAAKVGPPQTTK